MQTAKPGIVYYSESLLPDTGMKFVFLVCKNGTIPVATLQEGLALQENHSAKTVSARTMLIARYSLAFVAIAVYVNHVANRPSDALTIQRFTVHQDMAQLAMTIELHVGI
jgi:hypothetical protein